MNGEKFLENNLQRIFKKKVENASEKFERRNLHSEWRNLHSLFFEKRFASVFSKKEAFFTSKVVEKRLFFFLNGDDFSIFFLAWQIGNKQKKHKLFILLHSEWRNLHSEWRFLHSFFFQKRFELSFEKKRYRNFSPFKIEKSPY
jgi:hypothetical protein